MKIIWARVRELMGYKFSIKGRFSICKRLLCLLQSNRHSFYSDIIINNNTYLQIWGDCTSSIWPIFVKIRIVVSTGTSSSTLRKLSSSSNIAGLQNDPGNIADKIYKYSKNFTKSPIKCLHVKLCIKHNLYILVWTIIIIKKKLKNTIMVFNKFS